MGVSDPAERLKEFRGLIDSLDEKILALLNERATVALEIGATKKSAGLPVVELTRERVVVERMRGRNSGPLGNDAIERIYIAIMLEMRRLQD